MNKTQITKFLKDVQKKLRQDTFLNELPIFKKKVEEIHEYLLPFMRKLSKNEINLPSQELIKNIHDLDTNDEKIEALLEMMEHIQEQINKNDFSIPKSTIISLNSPNKPIIEEKLEESSLINIIETKIETYGSPLNKEEHIEEKIEEEEEKGGEFECEKKIEEHDCHNKNAIAENIEIAKDYPNKLICENILKDSNIM